MLDYTTHTGIIPFPGFSSLDYGTALSELIPEILQRFTFAEAKVMLYLAEQTAGQGRVGVQLRRRQIEEATGLAETHVKHVLHLLEDRRFIEVVPVYDGVVHQPNIYRLVVRL